MQPKQVNPKKFELTINKSQLDDGATYRVVLGNKAGECESTAELKVEKPNILKLVKGLSDVNVDEGQPFTFSCKITGTPKSVKWFKNGKEIDSSDERYKLSSNPETGEYSLSVDSSIPTDSAAFKVIFANDKGDVQSGAVAYVKKGKPKEAEARAPTFISPLKDVDIEEGDTLTLKCQISAEPQPTLKWYCNGEELKPSNRVVMRLALDGTATLRVMDTKKSDAGQYKVVATNPSGSLDSSCKVGVLSSDEMPSPPKFIVPLRSSDAPLGAKAEFNVKVRGVPKPTIRFQLDGKNIPIDNNRITLEDMHDGNWCLTIKEVKEEDFGTLRCVAENENGKDECEAIFDQTGGRKPKARDEEGYPPRFNVPLWDRRVPLGDPMFIECHGM
uniref:Ig-like domain-containing protein n=1 Tax=Panagrolaimus sp. PS1159 TaxID=55785 RepID=A0AC35FZT3_9BILA